MAASADIGKQQVASVYAKALVGAAEKSGKLNEVLSELDSLVDDVLVKFPGFEQTLASPRLSSQEKGEIIDRVLGDKASTDLLTFLKVLSRHERLNCLREVRLEAQRLQDQLHNRVAVTVTTAQPLTDQQRDQIVDALQTKLSSEISLSQQVDDNIIGGIVVRVGDTVVDGSVRNQLQQMRSQAVKRVVEQIHDNNEKFAPSA